MPPVFAQEGHLSATSLVPDGDGEEVSLTTLDAESRLRGWGRIDFHVLDWNPARRFYERLGLGHLGDWLRYGGDEVALRRLAAEDLCDGDSAHQRTGIP